MKTAFKHTLKMHNSKVLEAIALVAALLNPDKASEVLNLEPFQEVASENKAFFDAFRGGTSLKFAWMEMALICNERDDLEVFEKQLMRIEDTVFLSYFFANDIDESEAERALIEPGYLISIMAQKKIKMTLESTIKNIEELKTSFMMCLRSVYKMEAFHKQLERVSETGQYQLWLNTFKEGMKYRHPLSYAQEVMGKPFWNISDYEVYEFIPLYFISPYRMRLMDQSTMIYLQSIESILPNRDEEQALIDQLKVVSDPVRIKILKMLYMKPMYGKEIADVLGLTTPTVSHHLELLHKCGLLNLEKVKQIKYFSTNTTKISQLGDQIKSYVMTP